MKTDEGGHFAAEFPIIKLYAFTSTSFSELKAALIQFANDYQSNPYGITVANVNALFYVYDNVN